VSVQKSRQQAHNAPLFLSTLFPPPLTTSLPLPLSLSHRPGWMKLGMRSAVECWRCLLHVNERIEGRPGFKASSSSCTPTCGALSLDGCVCLVCVRIHLGDKKLSVSVRPPQPADSLEIYKDDEYIIGDRDLLVNRCARHLFCVRGLHG